MQPSATSCLFLSLCLMSCTGKCCLACCIVIGGVLTIMNRSSGSGYGALFYTSALLVSDLGGGILAQADYDHCQYSPVKKKKKVDCTVV